MKGTNLECERKVLCLLQRGKEMKEAEEHIVWDNSFICMPLLAFLHSLYSSR